MAGQRRLFVAREPARAGIGARHLRDALARQGRTAPAAVGGAAARARATQIEPAMQRRPGTMELTINNRCEPNPMRPVRRCPLNLLPVVTRYRLGRKIGSGSFGDIYLATNIVRYRPAAGILSPILPRPETPRAVCVAPPWSSRMPRVHAAARRWR